MSKLSFTGVNQFDKSLKKFAKEAGQETSELVLKTAIDIFKGVITKTPVDTGYARASWNFSVDNPSSTKPSKPPEAAKDDNGAARTYYNKRNNKQLNSVFGASENANAFYITNNVPYIEYLEQGKSKQQDKGYMITRSLNEAQEEIKRLRRGLKKI